jgi:hypothetical protein
MRQEIHTSPLEYSDTLVSLSCFVYYILATTDASQKEYHQSTTNYMQYNIRLRQTSGIHILLFFNFITLGGLRVSDILYFSQA